MTASTTHYLWVQVHRYVGLAVLAFLALAAATGCALVFRGDLDRVLNPDLYTAPSPGQPIAPTELVQRVMLAYPDLEVTAAPMQLRPGQSAVMQVEARNGPPGHDAKDIFVDPATDAILGTREDRPGWDRQHLMRGIYFLHYTLLAGDFGRWFMGLIAIAWAVENIVGFYLTLPTSGPFWKRWTPIWKVNFKAKLPRVLLDLHRASGLWVFVGVLILSLTSVGLNFYSEMVDPLVMALSPPRPSPWDRPPPPPSGQALSYTAAADAAIGYARRDGLKLAPASVTFDKAHDLFGVAFTHSGRMEYSGLGPVDYYVDDHSGRLVYIDSPYADSGGRKLERSLYPLHSGQVFGLATRWLVMLLGVAILEMSVTGLIVWWKKRGPRVAQRKARRLKSA